ncbi:hypothetical protein IWQ60_006163 [Tieghemiomyces parasiticus]|uniref:4-nitrophenylphosphatase n=1 Tax=Tieghemiomyces parasiticus TaxID=78921 RepID=A0A9W8ADH9_9FUNG|nr:hypothetical protein IWQ60_006163 [Tieghemiomyces parasiticus]
MPPQPQKLVNKEDFHTFVDQFDTFLLDCDGVLWHGSELIDGVPETLDYLRKQGKRIIFVTNNSTKSRRAYTKKFEKMGISASPEEIFGSAFATAVYLSKVEKLEDGKQVFVIGQDGIKEEFAEVGIPVAAVEDENKPMTDEDWAKITPDDKIGAVVIGFDTHINYRKYAQAHTYITRVPGCRFIATNTDSTFPAAGALFPGTGALVSVLQSSTGRDPTIIGKPHSTMMNCIFEKYQLDPQRTCMVGDRLNTDIQFGINGGTSTLLVLTGVTDEAHLHEQLPEVTPTYYTQSFGGIGLAAQQ